MRARSYNLEVFEADIQDAFKLSEEVNPFRNSKNELVQRSTEVKPSIIVEERKISLLNHTANGFEEDEENNNRSINKDLLRIFTLAQVIN